MTAYHYQPRIVSFCCHNCIAYAEDTLSVTRENDALSLHLVKMPCTGKVEILHLFKAVEEGADGVMVVGCLEGECHYLEGNIRTKRRVAFAGQMLQEIGFEGKRVQMYTIDSSKPDQLVEIVQDMLRIVNELGPSPFNKTEGSPSQEENAHEI